MPRVTIAIPTRNRAPFLAESTASVCAQTFDDWELLVVDNASEDGTAEVVSGLRDPRVRYVRNTVRLEMLENWNRCIDLARGDLLAILGDDDVLTERFLEVSVGVHEQRPDVGFTYAHCSKVDREGTVTQRWGCQFAPAGWMSGSEYILWSARYGCCLTNSSTVLVRTGAARAAGGFVAQVAANTFDFNLWLRLALTHPVFFIEHDLVRYRVHDEQVSALHWRSSRQTGRIGTQLELVTALSALLRTRSAEVDPVEIAGLIEEANGRTARLLREAIPEL